MQFDIDRTMRQSELLKQEALLAKFSKHMDVIILVILCFLLNILYNQISGS